MTQATTDLVPNVYSGGKSLTFDVATANNVQVHNYDNTYPRSNGAILDIFGMMQIN